MLENEVALVTGASRGIGAAIADALGREGAVVVGTATSEKGSAAISERLRGAAVEGSGMVLNVTDREGIDRLVKQVAEQFGAPTILVNNAGITRDNLLMRMKDEEWERIIDTDLGSIFRVTRACLRGMMKLRRGRVINIASVVGSTGNPGQCNYAAAKAGILGFTKSLAQEVGSRGITVNAVAPGFIDTDMTRDLPDDQRAALLGRIPLNRLGNVDEIASAVVYLASRGAGYITGETLHVNGGMYMA